MATSLVDYNYLNQVGGADATRRAKEEADAAAQVRARGAATIAEWQTTHPFQVYGQAESEDRARAAAQSRAASAQQATVAQHQNAMAGLQETAARTAINNMPSMSPGGGFGGGMGSSGGGGGFSSGPSAPPATSQPAQIAPPNTAEANANAFARSKDQVGLQTRGALTGLAGAMAGRGTVGSGVEGRGQAGVINQGQQQLGEVSRAQSINDATLAQKNAELAYSGSITQRGQDMSYAQGNRGQDITAQGQNMQAQQAQSQLALEQLKAQMSALRY